MSNVSDFHKFYSKWEGILRSGEHHSLHFEEHACLKLDRDDNNLKVVRELQNKLHELRLFKKGNPYGI